MKLLLVLILPIAEIVATVWYAKLVGGWMLLLWLVIAFFVGRQIMRGAAKELSPQIQQNQQGKAPDINQGFLSAICQAFAGILFIIPGIVTDALAVLLLLPPVQKRLEGQMQSAIQARGAGFMMGGMGGFGQQSPFGQSPFGQSPFGRSPFDQSQVFDGEAREVHPDEAKPRLEKKD
ncbi:FxsA family protein [Agitococcus lubricus]|uniref:UPF0716 protein FxsA n=1 Tax=Agitococcus lubricus TaxID=1077255 RepID=A0A2T5J266_9GAMM|nr:FxsA family protein [Agitococcus lubricus]PTQ90615.1 UPF0716 protein FxsA [Agitococcus lubricus]